MVYPEFLSAVSHQELEGERTEDAHHRNQTAKMSKHGFLSERIDYAVIPELSLLFGRG